MSVTEKQQRYVQEGPPFREGLFPLKLCLQIPLKPKQHRRELSEALLTQGNGK